MEASAKLSFKRIFRKIFLQFSKSSILPCSFRFYFMKLAGVNFLGKCYIGENITIDGIHPELVTIGSGCVITSGTKILTHFYSMENHNFFVDKVHIGNNCFIGMNTLIVNSVTIGDNVVIGAGSVVTKNIPSNEVWGGVPAKFIKKSSFK